MTRPVMGYDLHVNTVTATVLAMTSPTSGGGGRRPAPSADDLIELSDELADLAMQVEDDTVGERMIAIAARMRSAAFAGVEPKST